MMARVVLQRWVEFNPANHRPDDTFARVHAEAREVGAQMAALAVTHREEVPLSIWCWHPDATGKHRCLIRGVMNTERGLKLIGHNP